MMVIDNQYEIGQTVYLKTDADQVPRLVYSYVVFRSEIIYRLCYGTQTSEHYDFEISNEKNVLVQ